MLEQVYIQGNVKYLKKIYETYKEIQDETELIKIAGRIIQSDDEDFDKNYITSLFDEVYTIIAKHRKECRNSRNRFRADIRSALFQFKKIGFHGFSFSEGTKLFDSTD